MKPYSQLDIHPDAESLNAFVEEALDERERVQILSHLAGCSRCRETIYLVQEAAPVVEAAPEVPEPIPAPPSAIQLGSWLTNWQLAWIPAAALAAILALVFFMHIRRVDQGTEMARLAPAPAPQIQVAATGLEQQEQKAALAMKPAAHEAARQAPLVNTKATQPSMADRSLQGDLFASATPVAEPEATGQVQAAKTEAAMPSSTSGARIPVTDAGQYRSGPSVATWQQFPSAQQTPAVAAREAAQARARVMADGVGASRSQNAVAPAPQYQEKSVPMGSLEITDQKRLAGILAVYRAKTTGLPSGLTAIATATAEHLTLAIDRSGALFRTEDSGTNWERVDTQWSGRAVLVRALKAPGSNAAGSSSSGGAEHGIISTASNGASAPAAVFEILNDQGQVWFSTDGRNWKAKQE